MVKHGSKMIQAVSNVRVPKITLMVGASFGAGNYAMCGRAYSPRFIFGWTNYRMSVMGGEQAATVLKIVAEQGAKRKGVEPDHAVIQKMYDGIVSQFDKESGRSTTPPRLFDDGLIDPATAPVARHVPRHLPRRRPSPAAAEQLRCRSDVGAAARFFRRSLR